MPRPFKWGILAASTQIPSKNIHKNAGITSFANFVNFQKSMKSYLPAFLWISWDRIMIQAPSIPHFKDLSMRNLQYELGICQKIHNKVTMPWQVFANFVNFLKSKKSYLPSFLWISLDRIIVLTPIIPHF